MNRSGRIAGVLAVGWMVLHSDGSLLAQDPLPDHEEGRELPPPEDVPLIDDPIPRLPHPDLEDAQPGPRETAATAPAAPQAPAPAGDDLRLILAWLGVLAFFLSLLWAVLSRRRSRRPRKEQS